MTSSRRSSRQTPSQANFNPVARIYRWAEYLALGPLLTRVRLHFLPLLTHVSHTLLLGDGDGRFAARLLRAFPSSTALAVDSSATMLHLLRLRCKFASQRLLTRQQSIPPLPPSASIAPVDLVVSHFFLDCLSEAQIEILALQLASQVTPHCLWLISDFAIPQRQPWRLLGRLYVRCLYWAFRLLTRLPVQSLPDHAGALHRAGFRLIHHRDFAAGLLYTELWQLACTGQAHSHGGATPIPGAPST